jgi:hypothetical protein
VEEFVLMPRKVIKRNPQGAVLAGPAASAPGAAKSVVSVQVSYPNGVDIRNLEQLIWETATGGKALHQTARAAGNVAGGIGYIHSNGSPQLLLVSRLDAHKHTIEIIREGRVNGGVHRF